MFRKRLLGNEKGAALVWAICTSAIVLILVGGSLTLASSYYNRTLNETAKKQSYFSARSVAELIANDIADGQAYTSYDELVEGSSLVPESGTTRENATPINVTFPDDSEENMGKCTVYVYWEDDNNIIVEADANYEENESVVRAQLAYEAGEGQAGEEEEEERNIFGVSNALASTSDISFKNSDIYILDINYNYKMNWTVDDNSQLYATKSIFQMFLDFLSSIFSGWGNWIERIFDGLSVKDFEIITINEYNNVVEMNMKTIPTGADIINIKSGRISEINDVLNNVEVGKIYVVEYTNRNADASFNINFAEGKSGTAQVYFVQPDNVYGDINIESIDEGIELYYYGYERNAQLSLGKQGSNLDIIGGFYTEGDVNINGTVNLNGYMFLEKRNAKLNVSQNSTFNIGYIEKAQSLYSWEIVRYSQD